VKRSGAVLAVAAQCVLSACMGPVQAESGSLTTEAARAQMNLRAEAAAVPQLVRLVDDRNLQPLDLDRSALETLRDIISKLNTLRGLIRSDTGFGKSACRWPRLCRCPGIVKLQNRLLETARFESGRRARSESLLRSFDSEKSDSFQIFQRGSVGQGRGHSVRGG
jgi:hypothetical protein